MNAILRLTSTFLIICHPALGFTQNAQLKALVLEGMTEALELYDTCHYRTRMDFKYMGDDSVHVRNFELGFRTNPDNILYGYDWEFGDLSVDRNATLNADSLSSIGGDLYVDRNATLNAPNLKQLIKQQSQNDGTFMLAPNGKPTNLTEDQWLTVRTKTLYRRMVANAKKVAEAMNLKVVQTVDGVGGFGGLSEATTIFQVEGNFEDAVDFAAVFGAMTPEVQESTIVSRYVESGSPEHNADRYDVEISDPELAIKAAREAGFEDAGYTLAGNVITFLDIHAFTDPEILNKIDNFSNILENHGGQYKQRSKRSIQSEYISAETRKERLGTIIERNALHGTNRGGKASNLNNELAAAQKRNEAYLSWKSFAKDEDGNDSPKIVRLKELRTKEVSGEPLSQSEVNELRSIESELTELLIPVIEADESRYDEAKSEIEAIAKDVVKTIKGAFNSVFGIKRPSRAASKVVRWYGVQPNNLGDGARTNIIVPTEGDADFVFEQIKSQYQTSFDRSENDRVSLGYPKRLVEIRTSNGKIGEIQVMTPLGYLAKDGVRYFPEDRKKEAQSHLNNLRRKLGWIVKQEVAAFVTGGLFTLSAWN